ncbi:hypothetical protein TCAL_17251 [Tigriopus californicus]|uniref:Ig-like domain-containing protein n=1 Tax=Tigriopus californicus TaxID=6832 RepID=A0A553NXR7_TIGCA|nr:hypothetical protein TCAL_17251 [Tigriopus californicus]
MDLNTDQDFLVKCDSITQHHRRHTQSDNHSSSRSGPLLKDPSNKTPTSSRIPSQYHVPWSILLFQLTILVSMGSKTVAGLIPEFLSYKTCADAPPSFSGCMSNVTADLGERVVLNCQVDPRCVIQYLHWYHEPMVGDKRLLKTGKSSNDPYVQTINRVEEHNFGRYICVIANVAGETECSAYLAIRSSSRIVTLSLSLFMGCAILSISTMIPNQLFLTEARRRR